ncbi:uncharacterized protein [Bemisia tabaci]|nr:PREDICTED: uncharacterized protein LOC109042264 [Bemisia tabaci]
MAYKSVLSILVISVASLVGADEPNFVPGAFPAQASAAAAAATAYSQPQPVPAPLYPSNEGNSIESDNSLQSYEEPSGFGVQTGYEGYLVPEEEPTALSIISTLFPQLSGIINYISGLWSRSSNVVSGAAGVVALGGVLTTLTCAFTPLCTLTFVGLARENVRDSMRSYLTEENIDTAANFIREAYEKYKKLNNRVRRRSANKKK